MTDAPITNKQKIDFAMLIILKSKRFNHDIREWNKLDPGDKTWDKFQDFFSTAYDSLRDTDDLTIADSTIINQAQLTQAILNAMETSQHQPIQTHTSNIIPATEDLTQESTSTTLPITTNAPKLENVNHTVTGQESILERLELITNDLTDIKKKLQNQRNSRGRHTRKPKRYCWTHGCCEHWGSDCKNKAPGHIDDATFRNRHGGSDEDCRPN